MRTEACALLALAPLACASSTGPVFPTSERFPEAFRAPPSFAAEPAFGAAPVERRDATADDGAVRTASLPLDPEKAREHVSRFFVAVQRESTRELLPLLSSQASVVSEGNRQSAPAMWRARFAQLDYTSLAGRIIAPPQALRTYTWGSALRAKRDGVPAPASPSEVVIVARPGVGLGSGAKARLFGESLAFRLRPRAGGGSVSGFEIAEISEDFRLP